MGAVDVTLVAGELVIGLGGTISDDDVVDAIRQAVQGYPTARDIDRIVLEMSDVGVLDLQGVANLVGLWREARRYGKDFAIRGVRPQPTQKLIQTGVLELLTDTASDDRGT